VSSLEALAASDLEIAAVVTNPDRPAGRGMQLRHSPVKQHALELGLEILQPQRARGPELQASLEDLAPDVCAVVAYGKILPGPLLRVPRLGFVNLHFSLLPEYRGAAPVQRAIMDGRALTGVSVMVLTEGMDEGPVLAGQRVPIGRDDTAGSLGGRMAVVGAPLLVESIQAYAADERAPVEQDHGRATYAPKITTDDARITWASSASEIRNKVRGLHPAPGAWTTLRGKRVKLLSVEPWTGPEATAGELAEHAGMLVVGTGRGLLRIAELQLEGKRATTGEEARRGLRLASDERFE
jgi:methionyl-tRNA formyltransferase